MKSSIAFSFYFNSKAIRHLTSGKFKALVSTLGLDSTS